MAKSIKKLLITRFSALGDVAMTVPVVWSFAKAYPEVEIVVMSRHFMQPFFSTLPKNVSFCGVDLKKQYHGLIGLMKLARDIKAMGFDAFADFHDVLRTKVLRARLMFAISNRAKINKGRLEKRSLCKRGAASYHQLKTSVERYADVLRKLGFRFEVNFQSIYADSQPQLSEKVTSLLVGTDGCKKVGVAPFAAMKGKIYPIEKMKQVVNLLSSSGVKVFLFGAGDNEKSVLEDWEHQFNNVVSTAGRLGGIAGELQLISKLDAMISMDSSNMHFASLVGTRVISVWGATHPAAGFLGYNQSETDAVQLNLLCRPCSVYGKTPCKFGDYRCLDIKPESIVEKINK